MTAKAPNESMNEKIRFLKTNSDKIVKIRTKNELTFTLKGYEVVDDLILFNDKFSGSPIVLDVSEIVMISLITDEKSGGYYET